MIEEKRNAIIDIIGDGHKFETRIFMEGGELKISSELMGNKFKKTIPIFIEDDAINIQHFSNDFDSVTALAAAIEQHYVSIFAKIKFLNRITK